MWWWRERGGLVVEVAAVGPSAPPASCDVTVDVVGTVRANGRPGTFRYQWERNDGQLSTVLEQSVATGEDQVEVHLYWTFRGEGSYPAVATLRILAPALSEGTGRFTYECPPGAAS